MSRFPRLFSLLVATSLIWMGLSGCGGGGYTTSGYPLLDYFPIDGGTMWRYTAASSSVLWEVTAEGGGEVEGETVQVFSWRLGTEDALDEGTVPVAFETFYSAEEHDLYLHGHASRGTEGDAALGNFPTTASYADPPITLAQDGMVYSETITTETGGNTYTSQLANEIDGLQTYGGGSFDGVLVLDVTDEGGTLPFAGSWYLANGYGLIQFQFAFDEGETWTLKSVESF